jgi:hypothetical protein
MMSSYAHSLSSFTTCSKDIFKGYFLRDIAILILIQIWTFLLLCWKVLCVPDGTLSLAW